MRFEITLHQTIRYKVKLIFFFLFPLAILFFHSAQYSYGNHNNIMNYEFSGQEDSAVDERAKRVRTAQPGY